MMSLWLQGVIPLRRSHGGAFQVSLRRLREPCSGGRATFAHQDLAVARDGAGESSVAPESLVTAHERERNLTCAAPTVNRPAIVTYRELRRDSTVEHDRIASTERAHNGRHLRRRQPEGNE